MLRTAFLGDSHLARVRRDLPMVGAHVCNVAEGGASSRDLLTQAARAAVGPDVVVVVSVGTNDAAPWQHVPVTTFGQVLSHCLQSVPARGWVYVAPPGVDESRLGSGDRTNAALLEYRHAGVTACRDAGAQIVRADCVIAPLGTRAYADDGLHLSGHAYKLVLPVIAEAVRSGAWTA